MDELNALISLTNRKAVNRRDRKIKLDVQANENFSLKAAYMREFYKNFLHFRKITLNNYCNSVDNPLK